MNTKKIYFVLLIFILLIISCSQQAYYKNNERDENADSKLKYDLTTESGFMEALNDEEFMDSILSKQIASNVDGSNIINDVNGDGSISIVDAILSGSLIGDTNGDNIVNIIDALLTARYYVGHNDNNFNLFVADVNASGVVDIIDAHLIARYYVGLIDKFPALEMPRKNILIIVEDSLYLNIKDTLDIYLTSIVQRGYNPFVFKWISGTKETLRDNIKNYYSNYNIEGCFIIGNLPAAMLSIPYSVTSNQIFPTEMYFMDMDDTFSDTDNDGIFDSYDQAGRAEIYISRVIGNSDEINKYLDKVYKYRTEGSLVEKSAYRFFDNDFFALSDYQLFQGFDLFYSDITTVNLSENSTRETYINRMTVRGAELVLLHLHGYEKGIYFKDDEGLINDNITYKDVEQYNFKGLFYIINSCSVANFTDENCFALANLTKTDHGLVIIGFTGINPGLTPKLFLEDLNLTNSWGTAYKKYINRTGFYDPNNLMQVILGDPTMNIPHKKYQPPN